MTVTLNRRVFAVLLLCALAVGFWIGHQSGYSSSKADNIAFQANVKQFEILKMQFENTRAEVAKERAANERILQQIQAIQTRQGY